MRNERYIKEGSVNNPPEAVQPMTGGIAPTNAPWYNSKVTYRFKTGIKTIIEKQGQNA